MLMKLTNVAFETFSIQLNLIVEPTHANFQFLFIKIYLKFLKILLHVSVIRPSSGSF